VKRIGANALALFTLHPSLFEIQSLRVANTVLTRTGDGANRSARLVRGLRRGAAVARSDGFVLRAVLGGDAGNCSVEVPLLRDAVGW